MGFIVFEYFPDASPLGPAIRKTLRRPRQMIFCFLKHSLEPFQTPETGEIPDESGGETQSREAKKKKIFRENHDFSPISARLGANPGQIRAGQKNPSLES